MNAAGVGGVQQPVPAATPATPAPAASTLAAPASMPAAPAPAVPLPAPTGTSDPSQERWPGSNFKVAAFLPNSVYLWACGERSPGETSSPDDLSGDTPPLLSGSVAAWAILMVREQSHACVELPMDHNCVKFILRVQPDAPVASRAHCYML